MRVVNISKVPNYGTQIVIQLLQAWTDGPPQITSDSPEWPRYKRMGIRLQKDNDIEGILVSVDRQSNHGLEQLQFSFTPDGKIPKPKAKVRNK